MSGGHASVSINSLGVIDNLQIAATGLDPGKQYRLVLIGGEQSQDLVIFTAGIGGVAIVQTFGPLKRVMANPERVNAWRLKVRTTEPGPGTLILEEANSTVVAR